MKKIVQLQLSRLHVASHVDYHKSCNMAMTAAGFTNAAWVDILNKYGEAIDTLDDIVRRQQASIYTSDVKEADTARDSSMQQLFLMIDAGAKSAVPAEKDAGKKLQIIAKPYRRDAYDQLTDQTEQVRGLVTALRSAAATQLVATLLLAAIIDRLEQQNEAFAEIYRLRATDRETQPGYGVSASEQRKAVDTLYNNLVDIVNSASVMLSINVATGFDAPALNTLIDTINAYITQYKLVLANQAKNKNEEDDTPTNPPHPTNPPPRDEE